MCVDRLYGVSHLRYSTGVRREDLAKHHGIDGNGHIPGADVTETAAQWRWLLSFRYFNYWYWIFCYRYVIMIMIMIMITAHVTDCDCNCKCDYD